MIVDDEVSMRNLLSDFLSSQGYVVAAYASGAEALKSLNTALGSPPSAIITHLRMRPMSGMDFLGAVQRGFPKVPVLLFTGAANHEEKKEVLKSGAAHYLAKPFSLTVLKSILNKLAPPKECLPVEYRLVNE